MHSYSDILPNEGYLDQWFLRDYMIDRKKEDVPIWFFAQGKSQSIRTVSVKVAQGTSRRLDWNFSSYDVPIISYPVWYLIGPMIQDDVQPISCTIEGIEEKFILLNLLHKIDCINEEKSEIEPVTEDQIAFDLEHRPHAMRKYAVVRDLHIDPTRVGDHKIFRTKHWPAQIIRNDVRDAFLAAGFKGPSFIPV